MRSNPFSDLEELLDRVSRQVEEGMLEGTGFPVPGTVAVDVAEYADSYVVTADLPGYELDAIDVTLEKRTLELEATRALESEGKAGDAVDGHDHDDGGEHEHGHDDGHEHGHDSEHDGHEHTDDGPERYLRRERRRRTVRRRLTMPGPVEEDEVTASYDDGVLTVTLPKRADTEASKRITID